MSPTAAAAVTLIIVLIEPTMNANSTTIHRQPELTAMSQQSPISTSRQHELHQPTLNTTADCWL